jgi:hypothetical protein
MKPLLTVLAIASLLGPATAVEGLRAAHSEHRGWFGPDGAALPLQTGEKALEFLRTAEFEFIERSRPGGPQTRKAILEKDGIRAHAAFRDGDATLERVLLSDGTYIIELTDYYMFEYAAYEVALMLGLDSVPPTVIREHEGAEGSLQMSIEGSMTGIQRREQDLRAPDIIRWMRQVQAMYLFDDLIGNGDRNQGNILIDSNWKLWMVDHARAFQSRFKLRFIDQVVVCERGFWKRLQDFDEAELEGRLGHVLSDRQIDSMLERRDTLVEHIQNLIDTRQEEVVLYDLH